MPAGDAEIGSLWQQVRSLTDGVDPRLYHYYRVVGVEHVEGHSVPTRLEDVADGSVLDLFAQIEDAFERVCP